MNDQFKVNIAGIKFLVRNAMDVPALGIPRTHEKFIVPSTEVRSNADVEIMLQAHFAQPPAYTEYPVIFDSRGSWCLSGDEKTRVFQFCSPSVYKPPHRVAITTADYRSGNLYLLPWVTHADGKYFPFDYPVDEILMVNLLANGLGVIIHACGIIYQGKGYAFIGVSGAGKTTTANLIKDNAQIQMLSDDRLILRKQNNQIWVYGTPWHGTAQLASAEGAPLSKLFFLRKSKTIEALPLPPAEVVKKLFICCFPTFWNPTGISFTLQFLAEISEMVRGYNWGFTPDKAAMDFIFNKVINPDP